MVRSHLTGAGSNASKKREQLENSVCHNSGATISIVDVHCFRFRGPSSSSSKRGETKIMHRPKPTNDKAETSLARLAEIADAEFRRRVFCGSTGLLHPKSASTSMRKRSSSSDGDDEEERSSASTKKKKIRKNHGDEDDDGNDKMMQFRQHQAEKWRDKFEDLLEFRTIFGHCHVPHYYEQNVPLAQWIKRQRYQHKLKGNGKRSTLSDERIRLLDEIGFIWNSHDAAWEEKWNELLSFKRMHGDCIVPSSYGENPQLAAWVKRQRRLYKLNKEGKATSMTCERVAKLEKLDFAWNCPKKDCGGCLPHTKTSVAGSSSSDKVRQDYGGVSSVSGPRDQFIGIPAVFSAVYPKCDFFSFSRNFS